MDFMSAVPSNKPYLIRALHQWCVDHGFTPYIAVFVSEGVQVPMDYVKDNEIVLLCGEDIYWHKCDYEKYISKGHHFFLREIEDSIHL